ALHAAAKGVDTMATLTAGTQTATDITRRLAEYAAHLRFEDLPPATVEKTKQAILDLVGIAVRSSCEDGSTPVVRGVVDAMNAPGEITGWGVGQRYATHCAALLNATFAHTLDFDDTHEGGSIHPGTTVIPATFALGEELRVPGRRALAAI